MSLANEFFNYAQSSKPSAPSTTRNRRPSVTIQAGDKSATLTNFKTEREQMPSGNVLPVHTYVTPTPEPVKVAAPSLVLVPYSNKSFAIFGDTKPIKDTLFDLGGSFNRYLKRDGKPEAGYIFSNKRLDNVKAKLGL